MKKVADLQDMIQRAGSTIGSGAHDAGDSIKNWYNSIDPETKKTLLQGLVGAGLGAAATGGMAAATPADPDEKHHVTGPAALGALLGGVAGAGIPYGAKMLSGAVGLPGLHDRKPAGASALDMVAYPITAHPGLVAGAGIGTAAGLYGKTSGKRNIAQALALLRQQGFDPRTAGSLPLKESLLQFIKAYGKSLPKAFSPMTKAPGAWKALAGIPMGVGAGVVADKYLKGEY